MITPDMNARILEVEIYGTRAAPVQHRYRPEPKGRRGMQMSFFAKYARYALSTLASVAFGPIMGN